MMDAQELLRLLAKDRWVAFATVDDGQPRVRMMTVSLHDRQLWCFTSAASAKAGQLKRDDRFELVAHMEGEGNISSLRAMGRAEVVTDLSVKEALATANPSFKEHWSSFEDPDFMLLRLQVESIEIERGPATKAERYVLARSSSQA